MATDSVIITWLRLEAKEVLNDPSIILAMVIGWLGWRIIKNYFL